MAFLLPDDPGKRKNVLTLYTVVLGALNVILKKIMMVPMYNYPSFVAFGQSLRNAVIFNLLVVILSASGATFGDSKKPIVQWSDFTSAPIKPYIILGLGEAMVATTTYYAYTYLPGRLVILVSQGSIPLAAFGYNRDHLHGRQKIGSVMVIIGLILIFISIYAQMTNADKACLPLDETVGITCETCDDIDDEDTCIAKTGDDGALICEYDVDDSLYHRMFRWAAVLAATAIPMTLSSFYKLRYMPDENAKKSPLFNIAMTSIFAIPFTLLLTLGYNDISTPGIALSDWNENSMDGFKCLRGTDAIDTTCVVDECGDSLLYVNVFTLANMLYQFFLFFLATQEDAEDIFLLSLTFIVPVCSLSFFIPGFPESETAEDVSNVVSILLIMIGLAFYRKGALAKSKELAEEDEDVIGEDIDGPSEKRDAMAYHKESVKSFMVA
mmetsp:Transcript_15656/g.24355  ORF Transcript_15656/g.24355 Transcript_15656/m.24355 type:complete len:439 (+) Transcript_15656:58-1374(+)|eukprot:CAMPEP_0196821678 /NCGR_PEP_ID=MMETSP1362-20130617/80391_1 /TAXON_ID=163516 /ORGANISM="Leptocylindrus danicus, Strain CCMP1856" /LENGTH=438 /DNA_ID=CAMNT_0042200973 /DNA_START=48 /DNA_END=1364 /DNA_ORIENTATION=-